MTTSSTSLPSFASAPGVALGDTSVHAWWTRRRDGDLSSLRCGGPPPPPLPASLTVARLRQVHGAEVRVVGAAPPPGTTALGLVGPDAPPEHGDAIVATGPTWCVSVLTADCGAIALAGDSGAYGAVHAGWRGLAAGVIERAVAAVRALGPGEATGAVVAGLGPCIGPCCYEFSPEDLVPLVNAYGAAVQTTTSAGRPALDLPEAIRRALDGSGVELVYDAASCTACGPDAFSFRARRDDARQALLVWSAPT